MDWKLFEVMPHEVLKENLISVIVPVYNCEDYLANCVESLIAQNYKNFEIILINDGSTDRSGTICHYYASRDSGIKVIDKKNYGPAAARNDGIALSKGEFIFFIDADDLVEPNAINLLIDSYRQNNAEIVIGDFYKFDDVSRTDSGHGHFLSDSLLMTKPDIVDYARSYLKKPNRFPLFAYSWGRLFKSAIIKNNNILFNVDLRTFEDVAFNFDYLNYVDKIFFLKSAIYGHRIYHHFASATMAIGDDFYGMFGYKKALEAIRNFLKNHDPTINPQKEIGHADIYLTIIQIVRICGQINQANKKKIYNFIRAIIGDMNFRNNLRFYSPSPGDSKILPVLMKLKLVWPIIMVCKYKADRRYKKTTKKSYEFRR